MTREIKGLIFIFLGIVVFFPTIFSFFFFKLLLALWMIGTGFGLFFNTGKKKNG
jgi:hypothetical protein